MANEARIFFLWDLISFQGLPLLCTFCKALFITFFGPEGPDIRLLVDTGYC